MIPRAPRFATAILLATTATTAFAVPGYLQTNLVSNNTTLIPAAHQDPQLTNAWGIAFSATSPVWVSDNATGLATVYDGSGNLNTGVAALIPGFSSNPGTPTGAVFNGNNASFQITDGTNTKGANFLFDTEDGTLVAWNSGVGQPATGIKNHAFQVVNNNPNAVYKGLAIDNATTGTRLYAANFRGGTIETFGPTFANVSLPAGAFTVPSLPAGFAPFNIQNLGGNLFVTYAMQDLAKHDEVDGAGLGLVAEFDTNGNLIKTIASGGTLNAPWDSPSPPQTSANSPTTSSSATSVTVPSTPSTSPPQPPPSPASSLTPPATHSSSTASGDSTSATEPPPQPTPSSSPPAPSANPRASSAPSPPSPNPPPSPSSHSPSSPS